MRVGVGRLDGDTVGVGEAVGEGVWVAVIICVGVSVDDVEGAGDGVSVPYPIGVYCSFVEYATLELLVVYIPPMAYIWSFKTARARLERGVGIGAPIVQLSFAGS